MFKEEIVELDLRENIFITSHKVVAQRVCEVLKVFKIQQYKVRSEPNLTPFGTECWTRDFLRSLPN